MSKQHWVSICALPEGAARSLTQRQDVGMLSPGLTFGETEAQRGKIFCQNYMAHAEEHRYNSGSLTSSLHAPPHPIVMEVLKAKNFYRKLVSSEVQVQFSLFTPPEDLVSDTC